MFHLAFDFRSCIVRKKAIKNKHSQEFPKEIIVSLNKIYSTAVFERLINFLLITLKSFNYKRHRSRSPPPTKLIYI
jgi:hypothetical protein